MAGVTSTSHLGTVNHNCGCRNVIQYPRNDIVPHFTTSAQSRVYIYAYFLKGCITMLRIACYSRKSIYSDKSDSTDVQYKIAEEYCKCHYDDYIITKYEDEGYTGANTNRPDYNRLVANVKYQQIDVVICYKIDRISRNVSDFSNFFSILTDNNVEFVSIKEQIDTSSPLGRAMMYICSVFAQMERETIAERVKDNMLELAKSGKWAGGKAPVGYKLEKIIVGNKTHTILIENSEELPYLNMIVDTFLNGHYSLSGLETYFRKENIKTLKGNYLSAVQIYNILKNPHYAAADKFTLNYFKNLGCAIGCDEGKFNGEYGIVAYGRTTGGKKKKHMVNSPDKWIISVGMHRPLMTSEKWLSIQSKFGHNIINKTRKYKIGILKGVLRCKCGYTMRAQHKVDKIYNKTYDNYFCQQRNRKGLEYCDIHLVSIEKLDQAVLNIIKDIALDKSTIDNYVYQNDALYSCMRSVAAINKDIAKTEDKIKNITSALASSKDSTATKYLIAEIEKLDKNLTGLKYELMESESNERKQSKMQYEKEDKYKTVCYIAQNLNTLEYDELNGLMKDLLKECIWDGVTLHIKL